MKFDLAWNLLVLLLVVGTASAQMASPHTAGATWDKESEKLSR